jgi:hypothetical protein
MYVELFLLISIISSYGERVPLYLLALLTYGYDINEKNLIIRVKGLPCFESAFSHFQGSLFLIVPTSLL